MRRVSLDDRTLQVQGPRSNRLGTPRTRSRRVGKDYSSPLTTREAKINREVSAHSSGQLEGDVDHTL